METWIETWAFSETIHSRSYTHIQRNLHIDPSVQFDQILRNEAIMKRSASMTRYYDTLIDECHKLKTIMMLQEQVSGYKPNDPAVVYYNEQYTKQATKCKEALYLCMHAVNALEAIRFYVSFSFTFNFAEQGKMEGNAKIMRLIARDEALHQKGTQSKIRLWQMGKDDPEMVEISRRLKKEATAIFLEVYEQEKNGLNIYSLLVM